MRRMITLWLLALLALLACTGRAVAADGSELQERTMWAMSWGDFDALVRLHDEAAASTALNGESRPQLTSYMAGLARLWNIGSGEATAAYFTNLDELTAAWLAAHPRSPLAAALRMRALYACAWFYRGGSYANALSGQQATLFQRYIQQAMDVAKQADIAPDDVMSHVYLVMIARSANVDWQTQRALSEDALARHPDAFSLWQELMTSGQPKWQGDWPLISRMILDAAKRQRTPEEGDIMYAQLWDNAWYELEGQLFEAPVDWLRVKRGMRALLARTPGTRMINAFARLACLRQDRAAAQDAMDRIGDEPDLGFWGGGANGRSAVEECRRWLSEPDSAPPPPPPNGRPGNNRS